MTDYLEKLNLIPYLNELGFNLVSYGCTTCIGNSGPLLRISPKVRTMGYRYQLSYQAIVILKDAFIHKVKANWLASPPLVVAFAIAGTTNIDLTKEPLDKMPMVWMSI